MDMHHVVAVGRGVIGVHLDGTSRLYVYSSMAFSRGLPSHSPYSRTW
jgi:hypothetical protein